MMRTNICCFLFAVIAAAVVIQAAQDQTRPAEKASIQGIVATAGTGQPLRGARITFRRVDGPGPNASATARTPVTTDATGRFLVTGIGPGQYRISAERDGDPNDRGAIRHGYR
jgi:protocatechuate 3,4-dioxygenase beta subunit